MEGGWDNGRREVLQALALKSKWFLGGHFSAWDILTLGSPRLTWIGLGIMKA